MPELIIQRRDRAAYLESYPIYVNRKLAGRVGFAESLKLELEAGRYQLHCGGLFGTQDETWLDLDTQRVAFFVGAEALPYKDRPWPKYYHLHWHRTTPMQLKSNEEQAFLRREQGQALAKAFIFLFTLLVAATWTIWQAKLNEAPSLIFFAVALLVAIPWAYRGVLLSQLKKQD
jgi:hypothetical protein